MLVCIVHNILHIFQEYNVPGIKVICHVKFMHKSRCVLKICLTNLFKVTADCEINLVSAVAAAEKKKMLANQTREMICAVHKMKCIIHLRTRLMVPIADGLLQNMPQSVGGQQI